MYDDNGKYIGTKCSPNWDERNEEWGNTEPYMQY